VDFANLPAMIDYFSTLFGAYPFEKYGNATVSMSTFGDGTSNHDYPGELYHHRKPNS
jgi:hypothetical protein